MVAEILNRGLNGPDASFQSPETEAQKNKMRMNLRCCHVLLRNSQSGMAVSLAVFLVLAMSPASSFAATFTVKNSCSYTVYPGIFPATFDNGGWTLAPGSSVSFTLPSGWNGRIWGRKGCNSASPAVCTTGSCGGTGLECAGTTGVAGTSLAEFNLDASGTDFYDVSYVDGFDNPIGVVVSNSSCVSPNTCTTGPLTGCTSADLADGGADCLSPCTATGDAQFCCAGAFNTPATCIVANWPAADQSYVTQIHADCPNEYAYAYDDPVGLHTCATGANYAITFCPNGSGSTGGTGGSGTTLTSGDTYTFTPQNAPALRLDDDDASTGTGNPIQVYTANGTGAQNWTGSTSGVVPAGDWNFATEGAFCLTASGTASGDPVVLDPCAGTTAQAWEAVVSGSFFNLHPADNTALCLDVRNAGTALGTVVQVFTCNGTNAQNWTPTLN
jgi:thaumatin family protein/ricin-type beta-trefoil lectin protein